MRQTLSSRAKGPATWNSRQDAVCTSDCGWWLSHSFALANAGRLVLVRASSSHHSTSKTVGRPSFLEFRVRSGVKCVPRFGVIVTAREELMITPRPANEAERVATLRGYEILDTEPEVAFDDLTFLASYICQTPIALISLVDSDRQWFKSKIGVSETQTARDIAFCSWAILENDIFVVPDASQDERFSENPFVVSDPKIRFYAGAPLMTNGHAIGTLCVLDRVPRQLSPEQLQALRALSSQVQGQINLRRNLIHLKNALAARDRADVERAVTVEELKTALAKVRTLEGLLPICLSCKKIQDERGKWQPFERYVRTHSEATFAHRICPDCTTAISA